MSTTGYSYMKTNRSTEKKKKQKKKTWRRRKKRRRPLALDRVQSELQRSCSVLRFFVHPVAEDQIAHLDRFVLLPSSPTRSSSLALRSSGKSDKNRVCKTRFWFLELESYRLEIYVAKFAHGSSWNRVWQRRFTSSVSSFENSRCYFP